MPHLFQLHHSQKATQPPDLILGDSIIPTAFADKEHRWLSDYTFSFAQTPFSHPRCLPLLSTVGRLSEIVFTLIFMWRNTKRSQTKYQLSSDHLESLRSWQSRLEDYCDIVFLIIVFVHKSLNLHVGCKKPKVGNS